MRRLSFGLTLFLLAGSAQGQLVIGNDQSSATASLWLLDVTGVASPRELVGPGGTGAQTWGMAADETNQTLYWNNGTTLYSAAYTPNGQLTVNTIGTITVNGGAVSMTGLAFDTVDGKLYGYRSTTAPGFYEISTVDATAVLTVATPASTDFGGFDYDVASDSFYGLSDGTGLSGRGLYQITKPLASASYNFIVAYPTGDTDIDGLAMGNGRAYFVNDVATQGVYVYNLSTASFETTIAAPYTGSGIFSGGAWAPGLMGPPPAGTNLGVSLGDSPDCSVSVGGTVEYAAVVTNLGPENATGVTLTVDLPANSTFLGSTPMGTLVGNTLTIVIGDLASGGVANATVQVSPTGGDLAAAATVTGNELDQIPGNNSASQSTVIRPQAPTTAEAMALFSTIATSPTSDVPGMPGVKFSTGGLDRPFPSPDGMWFIMSADTDIATTSQDQLLLVSGPSGLSVVAQEGVTTLAEGDAVGTFDTVQDIRNTGQFVFSTNTNGATTSDEVIVVGEGTDLTTVIREGNSVPAIPTAGFGGTSGSATIQADGQISFYSTMTGLTTADDSAYFTGSGATIVAQEGTTIPGNQGGIGGYFWDNLDTGTTDGLGFFTDATAANHIATGDTEDPITTQDDIAAVNGNVVIQYGFPIGSLPGLVNNIRQIDMTAGGTWFSYGSNDDDQDWAVRNGTVVAATGAPIHTGATETWSDVPYAQTFFFAFGNDAGDYIIGGTTDAADDDANAVLVLNGETVVLRENDPVDLDGNGVFDDAVYVSTFRDDYGFINDSGDLYVVARLRDEAQALCGAGDNDIGQALIKISLGAACPADFDNSGDLTLADFVAFRNAYVAGDLAADFDNSGTLTLADFVAFRNAYVAGCP